MKTATAKQAIAALTVLTTLALPSSVFAQNGIPVPPAGTKTVKLSDLAPEVVSKIKAEHYASQDQNIQQAYHQQLQQNQQRSAFSAQKAAFEQSAFDAASNRRFAPATYQAPVAQAGQAGQANSNAPFPRSAAAPAASGGGPANGYAAPNTFMPPVHIPPPQNYYTPGIPARSINGRHNAVQNFAPQVTRDRGIATNPASRRTVPRLQQSDDLVQPQRQTASRQVNEEKHVFLQDRISNAFARRFKRDQKPAEVEPAAVETAAVETAAAEEAYSVIDTSPEAPVSSPEVMHASDYAYDTVPPVKPGEILIDYDRSVTEDHYEGQYEDETEPSYSEILQSNRYASNINEDIVISTDRPSDHQIAPRSQARRRSIARAVHQHEEEETFDIEFNDDQGTIFDRYESIRQTSGEDDIVRTQRRRSAKPKTVRRTVSKSKRSRSRVAAMPRPDNYRTNGGVTADNVSILLQESDSDGPDLGGSEDFSPDDDPFVPRQRRDERMDDRDRPNLRDDLEDADDTRQRNERKLRDRVRSRLDDELDLEELDREIDEELDEEEDINDRPNREARKTCREFQRELIDGSIRDISLDISPPAASEGAQYGGIARTWTDRRGNILATGALTDLRRGYVILDSGQKLAYARLSEADLAAISDFWRLPEVCVIGNSGGSPYRNWTPQVTTWKASNLCHKPLYFENTQLERYGHSRGPIAQPIHSTLHFFTRLVALPYMTGICPPNECEYALGYYRPGNCAPWLKEPIPISLQGIRREALFVTGAAFIP